MVNDLMRRIRTTISVSIGAKGLPSLYCHITIDVRNGSYILIHSVASIRLLPNWNYKNASFEWNQIGKQFSNYHMKNVRSSHLSRRILGPKCMCVMFGFRMKHILFAQWLLFNSIEKFCSFQWKLNFMCAILSFFQFVFRFIVFRFIFIVAITTVGCCELKYQPTVTEYVRRMYFTQLAVQSSTRLLFRLDFI